MNRYHRWFCQSEGWRKRLQTGVMPWVLGETELGQDLLEVGPGPGLSTDVLRTRAERVSALEIDPRLAGALRTRLDGSNVTVVEGDATQMPFEDGRFSGAVSFTMLHHVPSAELQDRLLAEVARVLRPGAVFAGSDSVVSLKFRLAHVFDTMVLVPPESFAARLERAGFRDVQVSKAKRAFSFRGVKA
jgi:SAM-dependent methyltransferase